MDKRFMDSKKIDLKFDTTELNAQQIRLVKSIATLLGHVLTTDDESEYFDGSAELMQLIAGAIKQSNFNSIWCENKDIEYSTQALEFCLDSLGDHIYSKKVVRLDN
tara:strand:+ start:67616 stop:67933 length:318 start_codon:yes stop_codon:yes gene_type:complete